MRSVLLMLLPLLVLLLTSCSSDSDPFGPYKTAFKIKSGCTLNVDKSKVTASCSDVTIVADLGTEEVGLKSAVFKEKVTNTDCYDERACSLTYRGLANKKGGSTKKDAGASGSDGSAPSSEPDTTDAGPVTSSNKGLFTPLEGDWTGKLRLDKACTIKAKSNAPKYCSTKTKETIQYDFKATVKRHVVTFTWTGDDGTSGTFTVEETKGGVRAANSFYPRVAKSSSDSGSKSDGM